MIIFFHAKITKEIDAMTAKFFYHKVIKGNKVNMFDDNIFYAKITKEISEKIAKFLPQIDQRKQSFEYK
jgi:hypothetical protein